jgi:hypothetical protein
MSTISTPYGGPACPEHGRPAQAVEGLGSRDDVWRSMPFGVIKISLDDGCRCLAISSALWRPSTFGQPRFGVELRPVELRLHQAFDSFRIDVRHIGCIPASPLICPLAKAIGQD